MAGWLDEKQAAVNPSVLDVTLALCGKLLSEICRMLVFNVLHNRVPAMSQISSYSRASMDIHDIPSVVVHLVTITGGINNVQPQTHTILLNDLKY